MKATKNSVVNQYLAAGAQGQFLSIANRNSSLAAGTYSFTCSEQAAALRPGKPFKNSLGEEITPYDATLRIQIKDKTGFFLVGARSLGAQPVDFLNDEQENEDKPIMKWPSCKGKLTLTLVDKDKSGNDLAAGKEYFRISVSLED